MGTTTFSGPVKAGTISNTTGTTVGTNMKNTGQVVMAQTHAIDLSGGVITAEATAMIIPANSQIIDIVFDVITAASGTTDISIGLVGGSAVAYVNTYTIGTTAGRHYPKRLSVPVQSLCGRPGVGLVCQWAGDGKQGRGRSARGADL